tara:strand:+ start:76 stop:1503 length:1428 start_codon:yes stop_codon:yes gene_type:complete
MEKKRKINFVYDLETSGLGKKYADKPFDNTSWEQIYQFGFIATDEKYENVLDQANLTARPRTSTIPLIGALLTTKKTMHELFQAELFHFQLIQKVYGIIQKFKNQSQVNFVGHNILGYDEHILSSCLHNACFFPHITKSKDSTRTDSLKLISLATSLDEKVLNKGISEKGKESLSLEPLAKANNIEMSNAHDAICDVETTISILKLIQSKNPTLYNNISNIVDIDFVRNFLNQNQLFLMKLANNSKKFTPFLFLGFDKNDQKRAYAYNLSDVKDLEGFSDFKMIKTFKIDNNPMLQEYKEDLPINFKCGLKDLNDLVNKTIKSDFDQLINERKESFQDDLDEIFDPEEKIFEPSSINDQDLISSDLTKLIQIADQVENPNKAFLLKKIVFEENPDLLSNSDKQSIYEILRERLLTNGFTYFTNIAEADADQQQMRKTRLSQENKHVFESYNEYLKQLNDYFSNLTFTHKSKFILR